METTEPKEVMKNRFPGLSFDRFKEATERSLKHERQEVDTCPRCGNRLDCCECTPDAYFVPEPYRPAKEKP